MVDDLPRSDAPKRLDGTRHQLATLVALRDFAEGSGKRPDDQDLTSMSLNAASIAQSPDLALTRWARIFTRTLSEFALLAKELEDPQSVARWSDQDQARIDRATRAVVDGLRGWLEAA